MGNAKIVFLCAEPIRREGPRIEISGSVRDNGCSWKRLGCGALSKGGAGRYEHLSGSGCLTHFPGLVKENEPGGVVDRLDPRLKT